MTLQFELELNGTFHFKIALRISGHLLLGVVRIYHRKAKYLLSDCTEALLKMQSAFRPGLVDLPKGSSEAKYDTITLPEEFHEFDTQLPEVNAIDVAQHFTLNQSRAEDITLFEEDYRQDILFHSNSLGAGIEIPRHPGFLSDSFQASFSSFLTDRDPLNHTGEKNVLDEGAYLLTYDGFGDEGFAADMIDDVLGAERSIFMIEPEEKIPLLQELPAEDLAVLKRKQRAKRKLLVDPVKELSKSTMQKQLLSYKDTLTTLDLAPPTRKLMILQELGSVDKLMTRPTQALFHEDLQMESVDILSALSDGSLADSSGRQQEAERQQTEMENELQQSSPDWEEKRRNKRTLELLNTLRHIHQAGVKSFCFLTLCVKKNREEVATTFYSLLVLKKQRAVEAAQNAPYADIIVTVGPKFHAI
uniref:Uncharacterized protein n=1 Tax=Sphaerodactylus townsendi TaxID=933632 RepID=A0ACB8F743_9SAUR